LNKNGKTPQFEVNDEDDEYSSSSDDKEDSKESNEKSQTKVKDDVDSEKDEATMSTDANDENANAQGISSVTSLKDTLTTIRQRSASVSPHVARPVIDFDDVISGKIGKTVNSKKKKISYSSKNKTSYRPQRGTIQTTSRASKGTRRYQTQQPLRSPRFYELTSGKYFHKTSRTNRRRSRARSEQRRH